MNIVKAIRRHRRRRRKYYRRFVLSDAPRYALLRHRSPKQTLEWLREVSGPFGDDRDRALRELAIANEGRS